MLALNRRAFRRVYADRYTGELDQLAGPNLRALAQLLGAIHGDATGRDQRLARRTAVGDAHDLEQIVELDELVAQREMQYLKGFLSHAGSMPLLAATSRRQDNRGSVIACERPMSFATACRTIAVLMLSAGVLTACTTLPPPVSAPELKQQVAETERAFARTMAERNHAAFSTFLADETVFFSGKVLRGKQAVAAAWKRFYDAPVAPFSWEPAEVEVLDSGTLAISSGPVRNAKGELIATFTSIWRREASGQWRIIFDKGNDACEKCAK